MSDANDPTLNEAPASPASGQEVETEDLQATNETEEADGLLGEGEENPEQADDLEEVEHSGKKYKLPKELKPLLMFQADYTRKTQELAEHRKALETERAQARDLVIKNQEVQQKIVDAVADVKAIDKELAKYANINWPKLEQDDFTRAQALFRQQQQLKDMRAAAANKVEYAVHEQNQIQQRAAQDAARERAKRIEEGQAELARAIPNWSPELAQNLVKFARSQGIPDSTIERFQDDPHAVRVLHRAYLGDQLLSKQQQAQRRPASPPAQAQTAPAVAPVTQVTKGRSAAPIKGLDDRLNADEWMKRRNEQLRKRA